MKKNYPILSILFILFFSDVIAQTEPAYEQYHFNQLVLNPAYAGSKNTFETNFFIHRQDIKIPGAPSTESFTIHTPIASQKLGLGLKFYHDHIGVTDKFYTAIDAAYQMYLGKGILSAGLEFSLAAYQFGFEKLDAFEEGDPAFTAYPENLMSPNIGLGVYFHTDKFFAGLAALNAMEKGDDAGDGEAGSFELYETARQYNIHTGGLIDVNDVLSLKPHALIKYVYGTPLQADMNMSFIFYDSFWFGAAYKTNNSISILAEYVLNYERTLAGSEFSFGYAFNFMLDDVQPYLGATHEVFLGYRFNKHNTKIRSPRFF